MLYWFWVFLVVNRIKFLILMLGPIITSINNGRLSLMEWDCSLCFSRCCKHTMWSLTRYTAKKRCESLHHPCRTSTATTMTLRRRTGTTWRTSLACALYSSRKTLMNQWWDFLWGHVSLHSDIIVDGVGFVSSKLTRNRKRWLYSVSHRIELR